MVPISFEKLFNFVVYFYLGRNFTRIYRETVRGNVITIV